MLLLLIIMMLTRMFSPLSTVAVVVAEDPSCRICILQLWLVRSEMTPLALYPARNREELISLQETVIPRPMVHRT